jgi:hypothetical protein
MGPGALVYVPSFIKIGSGTQKIDGAGGNQTHRQHGELISLLLFFQNKESTLKTGARTLRLSSYLEFALNTLPWILNPLLVNGYRTTMPPVRQVQPVSRKLTFRV